MSKFLRHMRRLLNWLRLVPTVLIKVFLMLIALAWMRPIPRLGVKQ